MTVLTQRIRARFSTRSLPAELVEAGKLPGTTFPASGVAKTRVARSARAGSGLPDADLIVDLSRISNLSSACAEFLPGPGYVDIGIVAGVAPHPEAILYPDVPRCDLVLNHVMLGNSHGQGGPDISMADGLTGRRTY